MAAIISFKGVYGWLSNFHPVEVKLDGETYPSVEHAYQAAKTPDPAVRRRICNATAGGAKKLGRALGWVRADWDDVKVDVMAGLLRQKFTHPDLRKALLDTGDAELVEGNWWGDTFWGVCKGVGENRLGKLLMTIRQELGGAGCPTTDSAS